jgi:transcriptional regulator with XRE-family HTH domain
VERAKDRAAKARKAKELSEDDLAQIAEMLNNGVSQRKIAEAMGVSQSFVQRRVSSSSNEPVSCLLGEY